jgi:hypothetical protein
MRKRFLWLSVFLCASLVYGQDEVHRVNFNVGGGVGIPVGDTSDVAGVSGNAVIGGGVNFGRHLGLVGEFMWHGLPPSNSNIRNLAPAAANVTDLHSNLYSLTANFIYHLAPERKLGAYAIGGGGWYHRNWSLTVPTLVPGTVCGPVFGWYGVTCVNGLVPADAILADGSTDGGGFNIGGGITFGHGAKFYTEVRYHRAFMDRFDTEVLPVTFGIRW